MILKEYQNTAVKKLLTRSKELLEQRGDKKIHLKAPTGSGKTIITAEYLKQLIDDKELNMSLSFIWMAPRKLHSQSKEKLEKYYIESRALECVDFEELTDKQISENEILFLNWESINKKDTNTIIKENEKELYLSKIIENTKEEDRNIILIIDESHHSAPSKISQELISDIGPKLTIEVSATPDKTEPDEIVTIPLEDVKIEGMIKKSVILNPNFNNILSGENLTTALSNGSDIMVLHEAIKKRKEIVAAYNRLDIDINPLLLIQLPNRKFDQEEFIKDEIEKTLKEEYDISVENEKLAIYLSEDKENLTNIAINNQKTEILIFKEAIALGWDCPRAHILVLFREWRSLRFSIQTVGRIMRMPNPMSGHYKEEILNHAYVFTNLSDIVIQEDMAKNYISIFSSNRISEYKPINLESFYRLRKREKTRLSPRFIQIFWDEAVTYGLKDKITTDVNSLELSLISDFEAESADKLALTDIDGKITINAQNEMDHQKLFEYFVRNNLSPFYPEKRSIGRLSEAIYYFFNKSLEMNYIEKFLEIINIILSKDNVDHFINVIDITKEKYLTEIKNIEPPLVKVHDWNVPESINFGGDYINLNVSKSAMIPFYYDNRWKTEKAFIEYLERSDNVEWWFNNGNRDATFFAVPYVEDDTEKPFYVDFIIKLKDGRIGLFDTKSGITIKDAKDKSDGLQNYIKSKNNFVGGIVTNTHRDYSGRWVYYTGRSSEIKSDDFSNWTTLDI